MQNVGHDFFFFCTTGMFSCFWFIFCEASVASRILGVRVAVIKWFSRYYVHASFVWHRDTAVTLKRYARTAVLSDDSLRSLLPLYTTRFTWRVAINISTVATPAIFSSLLCFNSLLSFLIMVFVRSSY